MLEEKAMSFDDAELVKKEKEEMMGVEKKVRNVTNQFDREGRVVLEKKVSSFNNNLDSVGTEADILKINFFCGGKHLVHKFGTKKLQNITKEEKYKTKQKHVKSAISSSFVFNNQNNQCFLMHSFFYIILFTTWLLHRKIT